MRWLVCLAVLFSASLLHAENTGEKRHVENTGEKPGTYRVIVSTDFWHSMVGVWPESDPKGESMQALTEWGYANKKYYFEKDQGVVGTFRALFAKTPGIIHVVRAGAPWSQRSSHGPTRQFEFRVNAEGYHHLVEFLEAEKASPEPLLAEGETVWYDAKESYTVFNNCHDFTVKALASSGIPIDRDLLMFTKNLDLALERAEKKLQAVPHSLGH